MLLYPPYGAVTIATVTESEGEVKLGLVTMREKTDCGSQQGPGL